MEWLLGKLPRSIPRTSAHEQRPPIPKPPRIDTSSGTSGGIASFVVEESGRGRIGRRSSENPEPPNGSSKII